MTAVQGEPLPAKEGQGWTVDDSTFGARLALVRQRMQWNIKQAATECGVPPASWASWEAGSLPRRYREICGLIADRTGADYLWILDGPQAGHRRRAIAHYFQPSVRTIDQRSRPHGNRPTGHASAGTAPGVLRTALLARRHRPDGGVNGR